MASYIKEHKIFEICSLESFKDHEEDALNRKAFIEAFNRKA